MKKESLAFAPERLEQLVEALPVGVFILDCDGRAVYANRSAQLLLGRDTGDGVHAADLATHYTAVIAGTNDPYPTDRMPIVRALSGERTTVEDMELVRGTHRIALEVTATPIVDDGGQVMCAVAVFQDITERRRMHELLEQRVAERTAELERASRAKSVFLMNVSHELRTPLNHVIGFSELLAERLDDPRSRQLAETATASGRELLEKIDGLIELARAETETVVDSATAFSFDDLLRDFKTPCELARPIGTMTGNRDVLRIVLGDILDRVSRAAVSRADNAITITMHDATLAERLRSLASLFGEAPPHPERRFQQQQLDLRLAITRARTRALGGDLRVDTSDRVTLELPA